MWWAAPVAPESAPGLLRLLDAHERDRLARFRRPADQARYLAAHALTRLVLAPTRPAQLTFDRTCRCGQQHGKPVLPGGPAFSMTHAGELVGVAVGEDGPVGLDVELMRELGDLAATAAHVCSPAESAPDAERFFAMWTRKEALLKTTGAGLATPMSAITLGSTPDGPRVRSWTGEGAPAGPVWLRDLHPRPGYRAAVAGLGPTAPEIVECDGTPTLRESG